MNKITLTEAGKDILCGNTGNGGDTYWIGYFGLAYVPDQGKFDETQTRLVADSESGDYIYNIWQGDLLNDGHSIAVKDFSSLTLYDRNITSNFRYVYDADNGRNRLVTWSTDVNEMGLAGGETQSYVRTGYKVYNGVTLGESNGADDIVSESDIPCPAPLFYVGGGLTYTTEVSESDFVNYTGLDWPMGDAAYPLITPDMRNYSGSPDITEPTGGSWSDVPGGNVTAYSILPANYTRYGDAASLDQYAKFVSVSTFNKSHGHVSSEGYGIDMQESCHNMSTVTKLFPIASYEITASDPSTKDKNVSERGRAKSIKYSVRLNLKEAYESVHTMLSTIEYSAPAANNLNNGELTADERTEAELFEGKMANSFKFNRIGIYAVPAAIRKFYKEGDATNGRDCRATHYQVEITPDAQPVLVAVMLVDEVCMSEDGSVGLVDYNTEFILNLESVSDTTSLCTNPEVYYNLVENEAITWYQNQLLATAGLSEAVTNLGVDVAHIMNKMGSASSSSCAPAIVDNTQYVTQTQTTTVVSGGGIIVLQDDGALVPHAGQTSGKSNVSYVSFDHQSVDAPDKKPRFSLFQDGKFTTYDSASEVDAYRNGALLKPNATNHIVWNTWYNIIAEGVFQSYKSTYQTTNFVYYDLNSDTVVVSDNASLVSGVGVGDAIELFLNASSDNSDYVLTVNSITASELSGECTPPLKSVGEVATAFTFPKVIVNGTQYNNVNFVATPNTKSHKHEFINPARDLNISFESLTEGLVYEIRVNLRSIARLNVSEGFVSAGAAGGMGAPDLASRPFYVYFYDNNHSLQPTYMWGGGENEINTFIRPTFNKVPTDDRTVAYGPGTTSNATAPVLATAIIYFVKVDGKIYVMGY